VATVSETDHYNKMKKITGNEASDIMNLASDKQVIHQKMQLWTNNEENEYAIRLILTNNDSRFASVREKRGGDEFIASTDPNAEYTHPSHKCTYCAIIFNNEEERKKHELALHI
jgi:hypothetical protein